MIKRFLTVGLIAMASAASLAAESPVVKVAITGLPESVSKHILKSVSLHTDKLNKNTLPGRIHLLFRQGETQVLQGLRPAGFYNPAIKASLTHKGNIWHATYHVTPGIPILIQHTDITVVGGGKKRRGFLRIIEKSGVLRGTILVHSLFESLKTKLLAHAFKLGFFDATCTKHQIQIDLTKHQAYVYLHLKLGKRYSMGPVTFNQTGYQFYPEFLQKYVPFGKGEPYKAQHISDLQDNINNSNYFARAVVTTHNNSKTKTTDTTVTTQTKPSQEYTVGPGYGTETGPRILLGLKLRHLTPSGQHFTSQLQLSKIYRNLTMAYVIPGKHPTTDSYSINAAQHYTNISAYYARDTAFGGDWIQRRGHFGFKFGLHEHWINYAPQLAPRDYAYYLIPSLTLLYSIQKRDGYFKKGLSINATGRGALKRVFSKTSFLQGLAGAKLSLPLSNSNRLLFSANVGATKSSKFSELSPTYRFYAGGLGSVLGYQYKSLSPRNAAGHLTGGKDMLAAGVQFEQHIKGNFSGILLYNVGNAFKQFQDMKLKQGAGIGMAYRSFVGPINLYITKPIHNSLQKKIRFNFSIGWYL